MSVPEILKNLKIPAIAAPMFIVSGKEMVLEQCKAGIVGSFPALNARGEGEFERWLQEITEELDRHNQANPDNPAAPFAVNQIVFRSNARLHEDMELCVKYKVPIIITSLGANPDVNAAAHSYGGIVFHDVINQRFARKAIEKGADGLIAVATGAGGHAGAQSPFALIQETREWFDGPLALSGCIATGDSILAAQAMGADFGYIGSAFIATKEANAAPAYKQMVVDSDADDIVYSDYFTGVSGNYLKPSIAAAGMDPDNLPKGDISAMQSLTGSDQKSDAKAWKDIWGCGQGIGAVDAVDTVADRVAKMAGEYAAARKRLTL
ncbi:2-nitropropane dioxygenase [Arenicella chitinivorans]|uniref:2-nitropropane dioxygenase n=1 Tax=Arenicella chitinivorans TaxID=1329800 RepID=A0A918VQH5_9GAMM|nr:nitronate monooxygenase family protein [Arenicella chitinivorans]GHA15631.1 2-nitropropane dioxygenase [Arenicella chitinivorans]